MIYAMMPDREDKSVPIDAYVYREKGNKLVVCTKDALSDEQMNDLYFVALAMQRTGLRLKDMFSWKDESHEDSLSN